jgi:hypothetical protein
MNRRILLLAASVSYGAAVMVPASAQQFSQVTGTLTKVAAGRAEVWGVNSSQQVFRFNATKASFLQVSGKLTQIAVGGGTLLQDDAIWGLNAGSEIFQFNFSTNKLVQVQGELTQITVGEGDTDSCHPYEVWGINANQQIFRYNNCTLAWDNTPGYLTQISTGGGDVWGLNSAGQIFQYNFASQTWVQVAGTLQHITVGVNDVWGINSAGIAYRYEGSAGFVETSFGASFTQIVAGGNGVWGVVVSYPNPDIVRLEPDLGIVVDVPGSLTQIAVGYGAGVWGVNSAGAVFSFIH